MPPPPARGHDDGPDEAWLRRAALRGEAAAWDALLRRHWDGVASLVRRRVGDPDAARDVIQEVWMIAVKRLRDFDPERGRFGAWLSGIATRVVMAEHRPAKAPIPADEAVPAPVEGETEILGDRVSAALARMTPEDRGLLNEKYRERRSTKEIAERLGASLKAIESRLARAREAFRIIWTDELRREERGAGS